MSLDRLLGQIDAGEVPSRTEGGLVLVDVAPAGPAEASPAAEPAPPTALPAAQAACGFLSADEFSALFGPAADSPADATSAVATPPPAVPHGSVGDVATPAAPAAPVAAADFPPFPWDASATADPTPTAPVQAIAPAPRRPRRRSPAARRPAGPIPFEPTPFEPVPVPPTPVAPTVPAANSDEDEMGPDPNFGEVDDGRPLDWRQARVKAAARRRPPPRFG